MLPEDERLLALRLKVVEAIKAVYIRERNARRPSTVLWNEYARSLHEYWLLKRSMKNGL